MHSTDFTNAIIHVSQIAGTKVNFVEQESKPKKTHRTQDTIKPFAIQSHTESVISQVDVNLTYGFNCSHTHTALPHQMISIIHLILLGFTTHAQIYEHLFALSTAFASIHIKIIIR